MCSSSLLICLSQVCFWPPRGFCAGFWASLRAFFAGLFSGSLSRWPYHCSLLLLTVLLHSVVFVLSYSAMFEIFWGHLMFSIFRRMFLWSTFIILSVFFVIIQSSQLYMNILSTWLRKNLIFTGRDTFFVLKYMFQFCVCVYSEYFPSIDVCFGV